MEIIWDSLDRTGWSALLDRADQVPLQQSWDYGTAMAALGATARRAVILDGGRQIACAQMLERGGIRLISRGPLFLQPSRPCQQRRVLRRLARCARLTLATPERAAPGFGLIPLITPRHHALWDLTPSADALRAGLSGKWRSSLAQAERRGLRIMPGDGGTLDALLRAEGRQRAERRYRALPPAFARLWAGERHLFQWRHAGQMQAAMLFLRHGPSATYHLGWTGDEGRRVFAHGPMLWQAALTLKAAGVRTLDLGDVNGHDAPGLAHFKLGTGAAAVPLGATCLILPG